MSTSFATLVLAALQDPSFPGALAWLLLACAGASLSALVAVRLLKLDSLARFILVAHPTRAEIVARLEQLASLASARDSRGIRRAGDQCSWRLLRRGADLLAEGAEPPAIAHELERLALHMTDRRVRLLRILASFSSGLVVLPLAVLILHLLGVLGAVAPISSWIAGTAFLAVLSLLMIASLARWACESAEHGIAARTIETEALIFGLSAIRGGAGPDEVGEMTRLVLGMGQAQSALRRAA
ncbi:MAG: hypothetical protein KF805_03755 [Phycisphaeraceae bacterium]|nr:hypothetical protein [Phycisphaeraceae bacterium]